MQFAVALIVWALELTGTPRDWLYRSSICAVEGGTVFTTIFTILRRELQSGRLPVCGVLHLLRAGLLRLRARPAVHLYLIREDVGFRVFWGGLVVYGWMFILPLWGMAAYPDPGFSPAWTNVWLIGTAALFLLGWGISRGANLQKCTFQRWPDRKFLGFHRA